MSVCVCAWVAGSMEDRVVKVVGRGGETVFDNLERDFEKQCSIVEREI